VCVDDVVGRRRVQPGADLRDAAVLDTYIDGPPLDLAVAEEQ
jgi:hypothetical protein